MINHKIIQVVNSSKRLFKKLVPEFEKKYDFPKFLQFSEVSVNCKRKSKSNLTSSSQDYNLMRNSISIWGCIDNPVKELNNFEISSFRIIQTFLFQELSRRFIYTLGFLSGVLLGQTEVHTLQTNKWKASQNKFYSKSAKPEKEPAKDTKPGKDQTADEWGGSESFNSILFIKNGFYDDITQHQSILVLFTAPWCHICKMMKKLYGSAAHKGKENGLPIVFATFDVSTNLNVADEEGIIGIPVIRYYSEGKFVSNFKGKRTVNDIYDFAKNPH